tara:strand:+ start:280 stop:900 length:621 start_codon:yes stop_codon:yes gene_type:complete
MENNLNSGTIEALTPGSTLLISARQVSEGTKVQLEFAEKISSGPNKPVSALALLNASDSRFSSGARRAWMTVEPSDAGKALGIDFTDANENWYETEKGLMLDLNILNPSVDLNGVEYFFKMYITESTEGTEWELENIEKAAKRAGKDGDYITHGGAYIFSRGKVDLFKKGQEVTHTMLEADTVQTQVTANQGVTAEKVDKLEDIIG